MKGTCIICQKPKTCSGLCKKCKKLSFGARMNKMIRSRKKAALKQQKQKVKL